jgi:hypothetical protein
MAFRTNVQQPSKKAIGTSYLFNHSIRLFYFLESGKEAKVTTLPKPGKNQKFPQDLHPFSRLSATGEIF